MSRSIYRSTQIFSLMTLLLCFTFAVLGQTSSGRIQGTVTDQAGGIIAGASVKITHVDTNREVSVQTNDEGNYVALSLTPGRYSIEVTQNNFKTSKQEITLQIQQIAVLNFSLEAGGISEVVNVDAEAPLVDSATSTVGQVVTGRRITELPLNGRNVLELARLMPGVTQGVRNGFATGVGGNAETYRNGNTGGSALSVNGQRTQANNFMIDGVDNNESLVNSINIVQSADSVEEFKVETSVANAESGRGGGATINATTTSGETKFSGSLYSFSGMTISTLRTRILLAQERKNAAADNSVQRSAVLCICLPLMKADLLPLAARTNYFSSSAMKDSVNFFLFLRGLPPFRPLK